MQRHVYTDPEIFELEIERLWSNTWICVGRLIQVPRPGDYFTVDIATRPLNCDAALPSIQLFL